MGLEDGLFVSLEFDLFCELLVIFNGFEFLKEVEFHFSLGVFETNKSVHYLFLLDIQVILSCKSGLQFSANSKDIIRFELEPGS